MKKVELPKLGKIHPDFFNQHIYHKLGASDASVLVKPQNGVDFGVVDLGNQVMVLSIDPFFIAKELGIEKAAWFAVHIIASDVAVSGIRPRYLAIDLNLPPQISEDELVRLWDAVHKECRRLGISVVTGHTARMGLLPTPARANTVPSFTERRPLKGKGLCWIWARCPPPPKSGSTAIRRPRLSQRLGVPTSRSTFVPA